MFSHTWRPGGFTHSRSIIFCPQSVLSQLMLLGPKQGSLQPLKIQLSAPSSWDTSYDLVKELVFQLPIQGRLCFLFFPATLFYYSFRLVVHDIHYASHTTLPKVVNHSVVIIFLCGSLFSRPHRGDFHFPGPLYFETPLELLILAALIFGCSLRESGGSKLNWDIKIEGIAKRSHHSVARYNAQLFTELEGKLVN